MTLELTDEQIIKTIAEELMGWTASPFDWNPLTDWRAAVEVLDRLQQLGWRTKFDSAAVDGKTWCRMCMFHPPKSLCVVADDFSMLRAITLAALRTVRP